MVGGQVKDLILRNMFRLDENLVYEEMASMKVARFCPPISNVQDKFILTAGGSISVNKKG